MSQEDPGKKDAPENVLSVLLSFGILIALVFAFKSSILDANNIPSGSMIPTLKIGDYLFVNKMRYSLRFPFTEYELLRIDDPQRGDIITFIPPPPEDPSRHYVKRVVGMPGDRIRIRNIPACELAAMLGTDKGRELKREYICGERIGFFGGREPRIAFVEYKPNDTGPWLNYRPEEQPGEAAKTLLTDSDEARALHPDFRRDDTVNDTLPVVFQETVRGVGHMTVESSQAERPMYPCPEITTDGCLIPENYFMAMGDNRDDSKDSRFIGLIARNKILGKAIIIYFSINWRDGICRDYRNYIARDRQDPSRGYGFPDFPPEEQAKYCSESDMNEFSESILEYLQRTVRYRIPRMAIRWYRIGSLLH